MKAIEDDEIQVQFTEPLHIMFAYDGQRQQAEEQIAAAQAQLQATR